MKNYPSIIIYLVTVNLVANPLKSAYPLSYHQSKLIMLHKIFHQVLRSAGQYSEYFHIKVHKKSFKEHKYHNVLAILLKMFYLYPTLITFLKMSNP